MEDIHNNDPEGGDITGMKDVDWSEYNANNPFTLLYNNSSNVNPNLQSPPYEPLAPLFTFNPHNVNSNASPAVSFGTSNSANNVNNNNDRGYLHHKDLLIQHNTYNNSNNNNQNAHIQQQQQQQRHRQRQLQLRRTIQGVHERDLLFLQTHTLPTGELLSCARLVNIAASLRGQSYDESATSRGGNAGSDDQLDDKDFFVLFHALRTELIEASARGLGVEEVNGKVQLAEAAKKVYDQKLQDMRDFFNEHRQVLSGTEMNTATAERKI